MKTRYAILTLSLLFGFATVGEAGEASRLEGGVSSAASSVPSRKSGELESPEAKGKPAINLPASGVVAAKKVAEERKPQQATEEARLKEEHDQVKAAARRTAQEREDEARQAQAEKEKEVLRQRQTREKLCVIKPVMTDAEIALCKKVWR